MSFNSQDIVFDALGPKGAFIFGVCDATTFCDVANTICDVANAVQNAHVANVISLYDLDLEIEIEIHEIHIESNRTRLCNVLKLNCFNDRRWFLYQVELNRI